MLGLCSAFFGVLGLWFLFWEEMNGIFLYGDHSLHLRSLLVSIFLSSCCSVKKWKCLLSPCGNYSLNYLHILILISQKFEMTTASSYFRFFNTFSSTFFNFGTKKLWEQPKEYTVCHNGPLVFYCFPRTNFPKNRE